MFTGCGFAGFHWALAEKRVGLHARRAFLRQKFLREIGLNPKPLILV